MFPLRYVKEEYMVPVNYLSILIAAIVSIIIGTLWYGPLFGNQWMRLMGFSRKDIEAGKKKSMRSQYALQMVGSLLMAYVLAHALIFASTYLQVTGFSAGIMVGFWNWLGFIAPVTLTNVLWEGKSWKLWLLHNGYYAITLMAMGVVLAVW